MKHKPQKIKARIHSLGYCSEGIGKVIDGEPNDITVFIDNTTVGDVVEAETFSHKKNYLRARLTNIIEEGHTRIPAACPLAKVCGGCQWQHVDYKAQLEAKTNIIIQELKKTAGINPDIVKPIIPAPAQCNYRAKVQYPLAVTKNSKRLLVGYYKPRSHELVNIKYCPVQPEIFNEIINKFRDLYKEFSLTIYNEKHKKGYLRHVVLRQSHADSTILLTFVVNSKQADPNLTEIAKKLSSIFPEITGVTVNFNTTKTNIILGESSQTIYGNPYIIEKIGEKLYRLSDRSFFQVNPSVAKIMMDTIYNIITEHNGSGKLIDIYAGVCAISIYLSDLFEDIIAIENFPATYEDAIESLKLNNISNIQYLNKDANKALAEIDNIDEYNWVVLDPPRSGCDHEVIKRLGNIKHGNIIYVSCNPATLARDISLFRDFNFHCSMVQPLDMFCHTYHVESISLLVKNG